MPTRPVTLSAAAAVEALEGLGVLAGGLYVGAEAVAGHPRDRASAIALAAMAVLAAVAMGAVARALWQVRRGGRAPALLTQIFVVIVAVSLTQSGRHLLGAALIVVAVCAAAALLSPPTTRALVDD